jgi:hypothetical protein
MRSTVLGVSIGLLAALLSPSASHAQRGDDWYRDVRPYIGLGGEEIARRASLADQMVHVRAGVRDAEKHGDISARDADHMYDKLDRVARHLRDAKHISERDFKHRRKDLDNVADDLAKHRRR